MPEKNGKENEAKGLILGVPHCFFLVFKPALKT
jgi:hypothetical protein